jgi:hypothetical protein
VPGAQIVTVTFGMFTKFAAPALTVIGTEFEPFGVIGWLFAPLVPPPVPEPLFEPPPDPLFEPPPELPLDVLPELLSPPPPQAASAAASIAVMTNRSMRVRNDDDESML